MNKRMLQGILFFVFRMALARSIQLERVAREAVMRRDRGMACGGYSGDPWGLFVLVAGMSVYTR